MLNQPSKHSIKLILNLQNLQAQRKEFSYSGKTDCKHLSFCISTSFKQHCRLLQKQLKQQTTSKISTPHPMRRHSGIKLRSSNHAKPNQIRKSIINNNNSKMLYTDSQELKRLFVCFVFFADCHQGGGTDTEFIIHVFNMIIWEGRIWKCGKICMCWERCVFSQ